MPATITHISQNRHSRRWRTFFNLVYFLTWRTWRNYFLFCRESLHLAYFSKSYIKRWSTKIDKYDVCRKPITCLHFPHCSLVLEQSLLCDQYSLEMLWIWKGYEKELIDGRLTLICWANSCWEVEGTLKRQGGARHIPRGFFSRTTILPLFFFLVNFVLRAFVDIRKVYIHNTVFAP